MFCHKRGPWVEKTFENPQVQRTSFPAVCRGERRATAEGEEGERQARAQINKDGGEGLANVR